MRARTPQVELSTPGTQADRQTASLAGVAVAIALVVAGLFLVRQLSIKASIEDCLMAGRLNCATPGLSAGIP